MAQTVINVKCIDQTLILMETPTIAAGGVDEDKIIFSFCPLWESFVKTAVFWQDRGSPYEAIVDDNDSCIIPSEVLEKHGNLFFGVYGINPDGIKRTSEVVKYKIVKGAITGAAHVDPTPDIYEQLLEKIAEVEAGAIPDEQLATVVENYLIENPVVGPPGADGEDGKDGADGKNGTDGKDGINGKDGKSAYQYAQDGGYDGTEEEFAKMLASGGGGGSSGSIEQIQADYTQNDSTAKDYIKNRPFYEGEPIKTEFPLCETILEQQTLNDLVWNEAFNGYSRAVRATFNFIVDQIYTVVWDGKEYTVVAQDTDALISNTISIGNGSSWGLTGNSEPFAIIGGDGYITVISLTDTEPTPHDVAIYCKPVFTYEESDSMFVAGGIPSTEMLALWQSDWKNCVFTWDGVEYICEPQILLGAIKVIGNTEKLFGTGDSGEPFIMMCADASVVGTATDMWVIYDLETEITDTTEHGATTTHEVSLVINAPNITKLDPKFLENINYETQLINKPFGTTPRGTVLFDKTIVCETLETAIDPIELVEGITYTVEIDGTVYTAVASTEDAITMLILDASLEYMIYCMAGMSVLIYPAGEHTVKITLAEDAVKKIDKIYLPDSIGGGGSSMPEVTTDDNDKIIQVVDGAYQVVALEDSAVKTYIDNYIEEALGGEY